jgi:hypothetical protein
MAGLLTLPSLLYLPGLFSISQWRYTSRPFSKGITAAGTVPDSHRIPLSQGGFGHLIAISGAKLQIIVEPNKLSSKKVLKNVQNPSWAGYRSSQAVFHTVFPAFEFGPSKLVVWSVQTGSLDGPNSKPVFPIV